MSKMECPRCGEIELTEFNGEYTCGKCGYVEYDLTVIGDWFKPMECRCGELTLTYQETTKTSPYIETWECPCGAIQCFHVAKPMEKVMDEKIEGFDEFINELGLDSVDNFGKMQAMAVAFMGGRAYQLTKENAERRQRIITTVLNQAE